MTGGLYANWSRSRPEQINFRQVSTNNNLNLHLDKDRFCRLWARCAGADHGSAGMVFAGTVFDALAEYYREPHRYYHTGGHINDCLSRMDSAEAELGRSDGVELAIWFHDVIYQSGAADNEQLSAEWFAEKAAGVFPPELVRRVEGYIMSTIHREPPVDEEAKFVVDVDLSGLGMPRPMFQRDGDNIRREFAHLSDAEFSRGQGGFLQKLLDRDRIFLTSFFHDLCETRARRNISEVLDRYASGGG